MSSRRPADRQQIERFLRELGKRFRKPGRIYLVGGTTMVFEGLRDQSVDIDLVYEVASTDLDAFAQTVRQLKDELDTKVEEASPADFIPLPSGAKERAIFVTRFGNLDIFHFDLYSTALSKLVRGLEEDLADVVALIRAKRIEQPMLEKYYQEIRPRLAGESLKHDPVESDRNFEIVRRMLRENISS
jgi:hypothetical protein